jgi:hypothetical protein
MGRLLLIPMSRLLALVTGFILGAIVTRVEITIESAEPEIVAEDSVHVRRMR